LEYIETAVGAHQRFALAVVVHVPQEPFRHPHNVQLAEGTLLVFGTLRAGTKVTFSRFIVEGLPTIIGTVKLAHVKHVAHLAGHLHLLKLLLAEGTLSFSCEPLI